MWKRQEIVLIVLLTSIFWAGILAWQSAPSAYGEICDEAQYGQNSTNKDCATYHIVFVALWHVGKALKDYDAAITALGTVVIAIFTMTLWWSTNKMWKAGEKQIGVARNSVEVSRDSTNLSIATLRARLSLKEINPVRGFGDDGNVIGFMFWPVWENTGQLPAMNCEPWSAIAVITNEPGRRHVFEKSNAGKGDRIGAIGVKQIFRMPPAKFRVNDCIATAEQKTKLLVWNRIEYDDGISPVRRHTEICFGIEFATHPNNFKGDTPSNAIAYPYWGEQNTAT